MDYPSHSPENFTNYHSSNRAPHQLPQHASTSNPTAAMPSTSNLTHNSDPSAKPKRRKVAKAGLFCKRSHMTCDDSRPCQRCVKREIGHLCCDEPPPGIGSAVARNPPQSSIGNIVTNTSQRSTGYPAMANLMANQSHGRVPITNRLDIDPSISAPLHLQSYQPMPFNVSGPSYPISAEQRSVERSRQISQSPAGTSASPLLSFLQSSTGVNPEQTLSTELDLNDILMSYPGLFPEPVSSTSHSPSPADMRSELQGQINQRRSGRATGTNTNPNDLTLFEYQQSDQRLIDWINRTASPDSKQKLLQTLADFQSAILAITSTMTRSDRIESERCFLSLLQEYTPIFSTLPIPACVWRRTGEIVKANRQFCELIGISRDRLGSSGRCIYELWNDDSNLNYWEKYSRIALDEGQKAVLTSCVLLKLASQSPISNAEREANHAPIPCTFSFTIRRDSWRVPSLIVGNFLPC